MAILEEANLLAERARHAKHRTHHVGTKLNEGELHEFEALAERRKQEILIGKSGMRTGLPQAGGPIRTLKRVTLFM